MSVRTVALISLRIISAISLFLLFAIPVLGQSARSSEQTALLEVVHSYCLTLSCDESYAWRIYANGTVVFESKTVDREKTRSTRKVQHREEVQLDQDRLAQLVRLTETPDFLNASAEYVLRRVIDGGSWVTITYRKEKPEKRVKIYNYLIATDAEKAKLPPSVLRILELSAFFQ